MIHWQTLNSTQELISWWWLLSQSPEAWTRWELPDKMLPFALLVLKWQTLHHWWPPGTLRLLILLELVLFSSSIQWAWKQCCGTWISPQQEKKCKVPALHSVYPLVTTNRRNFIKCKYSHSLSLEKCFKTFPLSFKVNEIFSTAVWHGLFSPTTLASFPATSSFPPCPVLPAKLAFWCLLCFYVYGQSPSLRYSLCMVPTSVYSGIFNQTSDLVSSQHPLVPRTHPTMQPGGHPSVL